MWWTGVAAGWSLAATHAPPCMTRCIGEMSSVVEEEEGEGEGEVRAPSQTDDLLGAPPSVLAAAAGGSGGGGALPCPRLHDGAAAAHRRQPVAHLTSPAARVLTRSARRPRLRIEAARAPLVLLAWAEGSRRLGGVWGGVVADGESRSGAPPGPTRPLLHPRRRRRRRRRAAAAAARGAAEEAEAEAAAAEAAAGSKSFQWS